MRYPGEDQRRVEASLAVVEKLVQRFRCAYAWDEFEDAWFCSLGDEWIDARPGPEQFVERAMDEHAEHAGVSPIRYVVVEELRERLKTTALSRLLLETEARI